MCGHCKTNRVSAEALPPQEESLPCEYITDFDDETTEECAREAIYLVSEYYCEDHLCEEHMREVSALLDEGFGNFLRAAGLQQATDFLPIREPAECGHLAPDPRRLIGLEGEANSCGKRAVYAHMVWERSAYCGEHAREMGYSPEGEEE